MQPNARSVSAGYRAHHHTGSPYDHTHTWARQAGHRAEHVTPLPAKQGPEHNGLVSLPPFMSHIFFFGAEPRLKPAFCPNTVTASTVEQSFQQSDRGGVSGD